MPLLDLDGPFGALGSRNEENAENILTAARNKY